MQVLKKWSFTALCIVKFPFTIFFYSGTPQTQIKLTRDEPKSARIREMNHTEDIFPPIIHFFPHFFIAAAIFLD